MENFYRADHRRRSEKNHHKCWIRWQSGVFADGNYIAYHAQLTPGYEADRWR